MRCTEFEQVLEKEPDGPLPSSAAVHLESCSNCRFLWEDLAAVRISGHEWGALEVAPPERVWTGLRAQLAEEGLIRPQSKPSFTWLGAFSGYRPRLALAGAYLSLLLAAASLVSVRSGDVSLLTSRGTEARSATLVAAGVPVDWTAGGPAEKLGETLDGDMKHVMELLPQKDSLVATSIQQNLGIVDNLIAVCEKSVREQPDNQVARQYLYGAYQQKAVLLATALDHSILEDR